MRTLLGSTLIVLAASQAPAATVVLGSGGPTVDLVLGETYILSSELITDDDGQTSYSFSFVATEALKIDLFTVSGSASNEDLLNISFNLDFLNPPPQGFTNFDEIGTSATGNFDDFVLAPGQGFTLTFFEPGDVNAAVGAFFETTTVPVPAGLSLMAGGLAALGIARQRRKAKA